MNLVIDANVAIKWFVEEPLHDQAKGLLNRPDDLHAPDLLVVELANVAWKKAMRREIGRDQAQEIAGACVDQTPRLHPSTELIGRSLQIALDLNHPIYDCLYLACAEAVDGVLITADEGLRAAVENTRYGGLVRRLDGPQ